MISTPYVTQGIVASGIAYVSGAATASVCSWQLTDETMGQYFASYVATAANSGDVQAGILSGTCYRTGSTVSIVRSGSMMFSSGSDASNWAFNFEVASNNSVRFAATGSVDAVKVSAVVKVEPSVLVSSPTALAPRAYFRADPNTMLFTGNRISGIIDQSGYGYHQNATPSINQPAYVDGGSMYFSAARPDILTGASVITTLTSSYTVAVVYTLTSNATHYIYTNGVAYGNGSALYYIHGVGVVLFHQEPGATNYTTFTWDPNTSTPFSIIQRYDAVTPLATLIGNGVARAGAAALSVPLAPTGNFNIGTTWNGNIYEIAIYDRYLSDAEVAKLSAYYTKRYGCV